MSVLKGRRLHELRRAPVGPSGNRVHLAIKLAKVTQQQVADATGFNQPYVSDIARSRYDTITVENAHKFAEFFGCAIEDLFPSREAVAS